VEREPTASDERDGDVVALEGLEAEFVDLESELDRVERDRGGDPGDPAT
jgi:hypothetical protein